MNTKQHCFRISFKEVMKNLSKNFSKFSRKAEQLLDDLLEEVNKKDEVLLRREKIHRRQKERIENLEKIIEKIHRRQKERIEILEKKNKRLRIEPMCFSEPILPISNGNQMASFDDPDPHNKITVNI